MSEPRFRVIVVGAGVAGLTASHCLEKAGIEHVVLERRSEIAPPEGASIAIYPHGARILHQIGCLEAAKRACTPCNRWYCRRPDSRVIMDNGFFDHVKKNHGHDIMLLERREFLQILYDNLPDQSRIRTGCHVKGVKQLVSGVQVTLADGSIEEGDIVIGCDGVNSKIKETMWSDANRKSPGLITAQEKSSMSTQWKALIGVAPIHTNTSDMTVIHNNRYSFLTLSQPGRVFFFVFFRLAKPRYWPEREYYSDLQAEELAATVASHPISESLAFGELWKKRSRGALISVEEGVLDHWHYGRIVLAGDSAHKVTPNIALGGNSGMESIVVLSNHLRHMMIQQQGSKPSLATLQRVFSAYQSERHLRVKEIMEFSSLITKVQAWDTPFHKFLANWVLPLQPDRAIADQLGQIIRGAPKLDFVSTRGFSAGSMGWNDESLETHKVEVDVRKTGTGQVMKTISAAVVTLLMLLGTAAYVFPILSVIS